MKKQKKIILIVLIVLMIVCIRLYIDNNIYEVTNYSFYVGDNKNYSSLDGKTFLQISDLHNKEYGENNEKLIETIDSINPNYILLTGDMVNAEDTSFDGFYSLVDNIANRYDCFYVVGNHELGLDNDTLKDIYLYLISKGVNVLDNSKINVDGINFYGLNYDSIYYIKEHYNLVTMNNDLRNC